MKEHPILFNTDMVKAVLDGSKTQTRRVMKVQPEHAGKVCTCKRGDIHFYPDYDFNTGTYPSTKTFKCPYGIVGDRLWVRETFSEAFDHIFNESLGHITYKADLPQHWDAKDTEHGEDVDIDVEDFKWTPSIFMPKDYSRITLEIVSIRVERLKDISEADAKAEGAKAVDMYCPAEQYYPPGTYSYREGFADIWDSINAKRGFGWDKNPWVWVVEFKRVD